MSLAAIATPTFYTFRRCPYAIRARLAIAVSGVIVNSHEVALRDKPAAMLSISPKATVPVLHFTDGRIIDESLDIMRWALGLNDPEQWLRAARDQKSISLIAQNDTSFKRNLDRYKYPNRFPQDLVGHQRAACEDFLSLLNTRLAVSAFLMGDKFGFTDAAIVPFIRQFAHVDKAWFYQSKYGNVIQWLDSHLASPIFNHVMKKR